MTLHEVWVLHFLARLVQQRSIKPYNILKLSSVLLQALRLCVPGYLLKHRLQLDKNVIFVREMKIIIRQVGRHFWVEAFPLHLKLFEPHKDMFGIVLLKNNSVLLDRCIDKAHFFGH